MDVGIIQFTIHNFQLQRAVVSAWLHVLPPVGLALARASERRRLPRPSPGPRFTKVTVRHPVPLRGRVAQGGEI